MDVEERSDDDEKDDDRGESPAKACARIGGDDREGGKLLREACATVPDDEEFPFLIKLDF